MFNIIAAITGLYIWQANPEVACAIGLSFLWVPGGFS